jgi:hypothetical protein
MSFMPLTQDGDSRWWAWQVEDRRTRGYWFALGYFAGSIVTLLFVMGLRVLRSV